MSEDDKNRGVAVVVGHHHQQHHNHHHDQPPPPPPPPPQYGTFQGVANYPPPAIGFPQPVPPPGAGAHGSSAPPSQYYAQGYQTVPGYAVAEGRPARERRLPCCGLGLGWCLFIIGFFLGTIPWYIGLFVLMCGRIDHREKPGYIACTIAAALTTVAIVLGATKGADEW